MKEPRSGLFTAGNRAVPLEGVRIDARLTGLATEVTVRQRYRNAEQVPVEAVYVFPLEEGAAVCGFAARIGETVVRGHVEERDKAFEIYDDAMAAGHGAFLLDQERPNVFTAQVGNLRPGETVEVEIVYVALARFEGTATRLMIPTSVSPRYAPAAPPEVGQPDAERVNPERWLTVPYGLTLTVEIDAEGIESLDSPSHPVRTHLRAGGATVELSSREAALDRDFVLLVETTEPHHPAARVAREEDGTRVCQLTFFPELTDELNHGSEVLFLLDCSGSMLGDSIAQAKRALLLSIRALEEGDTFNVVRFGSRYETLWPAPRAFSQQTLEEATPWVQHTGAELGGTEILRPLRHLLEQPIDRERPRQVLLLTDGEVANEHEIVRLAERHATTARVFTFGIGAGASEVLIRELARATRGAAEFIYPGERIEPKVLRMFGRVRTPALTGVGVDWGGLEVEQAPAETPPVFAGDSLTVFARVRSGSTAAVALTAGAHRWEIPLDLGAAEAGGPVPTLWARQAIRDLEAGVSPRRGSAQRRPAAEERQRRRLLELCRRYGLTSSVASYVAVEERPEAERSEGPAELRKIPVALTAGWGGIGHLTLAGGLESHSPSRIPPQAFPQAPMPTSAPLPSAAAAASPDLFMELEAATESVTEQALHAVNGLFERLRPRARAPQPPPDVPLEATLGDAEVAVDLLYEVLMTQQADGSFPLSEALAERLGRRLPAVERAAAEHGAAVVATAVVVALCERHEADRADEWRPAVRKARRWLERRGGGFDAASLVEDGMPAVSGSMVGRS